jgi:hypothetical protein
VDQQQFLLHRVEQELSRSQTLLPEEAVNEYQAAIRHYRELLPKPQSK